MRVALFGLGSMGSRIAQRLVAAGHSLTVWSRSGVSGELAAHAQPTARQAAHGADVAIAMVTDDEASRRVWLGEDGALSGLRAGAVAIESSTLTPRWVSELALHAERRGVRFLDAPVVGSRPQAEQGALVVLVSGAADGVERARPVFAAYASAVHALGASPRATVVKLAVNALFASQVAMLGELLAGARTQGVEPSLLMEVLGSLPVLSPAAKGAGLAIVAGRFEPMFPIALVAKDLRYAVLAQTAAMPLTDALRARYADAEASGLGAENLTAIAKLASHPTQGETR